MVPEGWRRLVSLCPVAAWLPTGLKERGKDKMYQGLLSESVLRMLLEFPLSNISVSLLYLNTDCLIPHCSGIWGYACCCP